MQVTWNTLSSLDEIFPKTGGILGLERLDWDYEQWLNAVDCISLLG